MLAGERPLVRNPNSVRPWQHVMEAVGGYLLIAEKLLDGEDEFATAWNFGPAEEDARPVAWIVERMLELWGSAGWDRPDTLQPHEATLLKLDCSKARNASVGVLVSTLTRLSRRSWIGTREFLRATMHVSLLSGNCGNMAG